MFAAGVLVLGAAALSVWLFLPGSSSWPFAGGEPGGGDTVHDGGVLGDGVLDAEDGVIDGADRPTVFDDEVPAVARLSPTFRDALRAAASDARGSGVEFLVTSGWRSAELQRSLQRDALARYGSEEEAARWVATPEASKHVTGDAVDLGDWDALDWLAQHGSRYGLCQTLANEPWHYEYRPEAIGGVCPEMSTDAADAS